MGSDNPISHKLLPSHLVEWTLPLGVLHSHFLFFSSNGSHARPFKRPPKSSFRVRFCIPRDPPPTRSSPSPRWCPLLPLLSHHNQDHSLTVPSQKAPWVISSEGPILLLLPKKSPPPPRLVLCVFSISPLTYFLSGRHHWFLEIAKCF